MVTIEDVFTYPQVVPRVKHSIICMGFPPRAGTRHVNALLPKSQIEVFWNVAWKSSDQELTKKKQMNDARLQIEFERAARHLPCSLCFPPRCVRHCVSALLLAMALLDSRT